RHRFPPSGPRHNTALDLKPPSQQAACARYEAGRYQLSNPGTAGQNAANPDRRNFNDLEIVFELLQCLQCSTAAIPEIEIVSDAKRSGPEAVHQVLTDEVFGRQPRKGLIEMCEAEEIDAGILNKTDLLIERAAQPGRTVRREKLHGVRRECHGDRM